MQMRVAYRWATLRGVGELEANQNRGGVLAP